MSKSVVSAIPAIIAFLIASFLAVVVHDSWSILVEIRMIAVLLFVVTGVFVSTRIDISSKGPSLIRRWWIGGLQALLVFVLSTILHAVLFPGSGGMAASVVGQAVFALIVFGWLVFIIGVACSIIVKSILRG